MESVHCLLNVVWEHVLGSVDTETSHPPVYQLIHPVSDLTLDIVAGSPEITQAKQAAVTHLVKYN